VTAAGPGASFDGGVYHNEDRARDIQKGFVDVLKWRLSSRDRARWPAHAANDYSPSLPRSLSDGEVAVTGINHATDLLQFSGLNLLTDPVFSERVSPVSWAGPRRVRAPGLAFDALPKIDAVLVSHNHYDHMDLPSLARLWRRDRPLFVVPLGNARTLSSAGIEGTVELDWWQTHRFGDAADVTLVPAQHWSGRGLFDRRRALWGGFFIRRGAATAYFAGDTGYGQHFAEIRERLGSPRVALLPIGAYEPRWFMRDQHIDPDEAVRAHLALGATVSLGMHFGTFPLADEGMDDPPAVLAAARRARGVAEAAFPALYNGLTIVATVTR
jgi:L-ascorbate metabolism protein UlaG (beta-lactamase superfamily)